MSFTTGAIRSIFICIVFLMSSIFISIPDVFTGPADGSQAPPVSGDWVVTGTESYANAEFIVNGDLIVQNGGTLTLSNIDLRMNATAPYHPMWIIVENGGTLNIWDADNDPFTDDGCNVSDHTYDVDDESSLDYRYYFRVEEGGVLSINNSHIEECGKGTSAGSDLTGIYIESDFVEIKNTSIAVSGYALTLMDADNTIIESVNVSNVYMAIYALNCDGTIIKDCWLNGTDIDYGIKMKYCSNLTVSGTNVSSYYMTFYFDELTNSVFKNNVGDRVQHSSSTKVFEIRYSHNLIFDGFRSSDYDFIFFLFRSINLTFSNLNISGIPVVWTALYGSLYFSQCKDIMIDNSRFFKQHGSNIVNSRTDNMIIENSHFEEAGIRGIRFDHHNDGSYQNYLTVNNCTFKKLGHKYSNQAITLGTTQNVTLTNNKITLPGSSGIQLSTCKNVYANNNTISDGKVSSSYGFNIHSSSNIVIENTTVWNITRSGIELFETNQFSIRSTNLTGVDNKGRGIYVRTGCSNGTVTDAIITGYYIGIEDDIGTNFTNINISDSNEDGFVGSGSVLENVTVYKSTWEDNLRAKGPITAKNSTFILAKDYDINVDAIANVTLINCTFNASKINVASGGYLHTGWWADVFVNDTNGPVPGAYIKSLNNTGFQDAEGITDQTGHALLPLIERTYYYDGTLKSYSANPHNISAELWPYTAYVDPEPSITENKRYYITFNADTPPTAPTNLDAYSISDDVFLLWDYIPLYDLDHFEIFRSTDPQNFGATPFVTVGSGTQSWLDNDAATDWTTYHYQVHANDTGGNLGKASNTASCSDWIVSAGNNTQVSNMDIVLNSVLTIETGGTLKLTDVSITFNTSTMDEQGVLVQPGGVLEIIDGDNDKLTTADASNITVLDPDYSIYFIISSGGKLYMNNSQVYGVTNGMDIDGDGSIIRGNQFGGGFRTEYGMILDGISNVQVIDNDFEPVSKNTIYISASSYCTIENNYLTGSGEEGLFIINTNNDTIKGNTIENCLTAVYLQDTFNETFRDNTISNNTDYGIYYSYSNGLIIQNNTIRNHLSSSLKGYGLYGSESEVLIIEENNFTNNEVAIYSYHHYNCQIDSNMITDHKSTGIFIENCVDYWIVNNTITDSDIEGIKIEQGWSHPSHSDYYNSYIIGGNVSQCLYGIYLETGYNIYIQDIDLYNNVDGLYAKNSRYVDVNQARCEKNSRYGLFVNGYTGGGGYSAVSLENVTLVNPDGKNIGLDTDTEVTAINTTIPIDSINFADSYSRLTFYWYVDIYVEDRFGDPAQSASVNCKPMSGTTVIGTTNSAGYIKWFKLLDKTMLKDGNINSNPYTVTATLGNHSGENQTNIESSTIIYIKITNDKPSALNVQLAPAAPSTLEDLQLSFTYDDPENDPEGQYIIKWFRSGIEDITLANQKTVSASKTGKGQNWFASVIVFDGVAYSDSVLSNVISIQNTKPTVSGVSVSPLLPRSTEDITVDYTFSDVDNDEDDDTIITWYVDRGLGYVDSGQSGPELNFTQTWKGDKWKARVLPYDGEEYGSSLNSSNVAEVGNAPPQIIGEVTIAPAEPVSASDLNASYTYFDIDIDIEGTSTYKWYVIRVGKTSFEDSGLTGKTVPSSETQKGEQWYFEVTPFDGTEYGPMKTSEPVTIGNTKPYLVGTVDITPLSPNSANDLVVNYNYSDVDDDPESTTSFRWYVKKIGQDFVFSGVTDDTVLSRYLIKGEQWYCEVLPFDGTEYGDPVQSNIITVINTPPLVSDLTIIPEDPIGAQPITAEYKYFDTDSDSEDIGNRQVRWYRNDEQVPDHDDKITIPSNVTKKGEAWHFTLEVTDGEESSSIETSTKVTIKNTQPIVTGLSITPSSPTNSDDIKANYIFSDFDGDTEDKVEIEWYRNEGHIPGYDDLLTVDSGMTKKQDVWFFKIRVYDGEEFSEWETSPPKLIKNLNPELSVIPAEKVLTINETESITFMAQAVDKDNDPLTFFWYLDGDIKSLDTKYTFESDYESKESYNVTIEVSDGTATVSFSWDVSVQNLDRRPSISIQTPEGTKDISITNMESQEFVIIADDPDSEDKSDLKISWFLNDSPVGSGDDRYVYQPGEKTEGTYVVKVEVFDGELKTETSWNVTVTEDEAGKDTGEKLMGQSYDWWGLVLAILSGIITAILFIFGFFRMRKKMDELKDYMAKIEDIVEKDLKPILKEKELMKLKKDVKHQFSNGEIKENHFIILEKEIDESLGEVRKRIVDRHVDMPSDMKEDVDEILDDGKVTDKEHSDVKKKILESDELSPEEKEKLEALMGDWAEEGKE